MSNKTETSLAVFETFNIRRHYDEAKGKWYFSVVDIIAALIDQPDFHTARKYWNKLKERLKNEGSEVVTNCHRLKMIAQDGKKRETDAAEVETILRLVQSVRSEKAEGFDENKLPAKKGGKIAKDARKALEQKTGKKVVTGDNFLPPSKTKKKLKGN